MTKTQTTKVCTKCRQAKPATTEFFAQQHRRGKTKLVERCKKCANKQTAEWAKRNKERIQANQRRWYEENREHHRQWQREWNARNPEKRRCATQKHYWHGGGRQKSLARQETPLYVWKKYEFHARKRGIPFNLTVADFETFAGSECFYCGERLLKVRLDRQDNSSGYRMGNVVPCCKSCNYGKHVLSFTDFVAMCVRVTARHGRVLQSQ